jgi:hypothetical protein
MVDPALVRDDAAGDDHVEDRTLAVGEGREGNPRAVDQGDAGGTDRAAERQAGDLGGRRCGVDGQHVVLGVGVERQDRDDDLDLVAQTLLEGRAQRPVDQAAGEDRVGGGATLATEERAGDLAGGIHALFDVHRQREEVELVFRVLAGRGGRKQHRVFVEVGDNCAAGLLGQAPGLKPDRAGAEGAIVDGGFGELNFWTLHGVTPFLSSQPCIVVVHALLKRFSCPALMRMERLPPRSWRWPLHRMERLSAQTEALDQLTVASDVGGLQVTQHALASTDQQQQTAAAVVIVLVLTRVLGEIQDATGEHRDLNLGGTRVALFGGVLGHDLLLYGTFQGHAVSPR